MAVTGTGTGIINFTASGDSYAGIIILDSCRWVGASAAGHLCLVTDGSGNTIFRGEADGPNYTDGWVFSAKWVSSLTISSMNSGSFQAYEASK